MVLRRLCEPKPFVAFVLDMTCEVLRPPSVLTKMTWESMPLGEFVTLKRGYDLPSSLRADGPVPVVSSSGVTGHHDVAKVKGPGVVTGRYGTLGEVFFIDEDFWPLNTALYVRDFQGNDPGFTAYFLESVLRNTDSNKAAVPGVNRNDLHALTVRTTRDLEKQRAIASVLRAYDDLIDNNRRRIRLLEQVARMIYEDWLVRFRFPGHELVHGSEQAPEGWKKERLSEIAQITMGQSPKSIHYNRDGIGLPFHQGVTNFGVRFPNHDVFCTEQNRIAEPGDILFSVRAPVGRINISPDKIVIGRGVAAIRSQRGQQNLLFYALKTHFVKKDMMGSGAIFAAITKGDLHGLALLQPPSQLAAKFTELVRPIDEGIAYLHRSIDALAKARNLLLPRLMSGEIAA